MTINKRRFEEELAADLGKTMSETERIVNAFLGKIYSYLGRGNAVNLSGFGKFSVSHRNARLGVNPRTRVKMTHSRFTHPQGDQHGMNVEYELRVPRDSKLVIHHGTGYVSVNNVNGDIEATGGRGDIVLMLPDSGAYAIDAKSKFGTVSSDFDGSAHLQHLIGERYANGGAASARRIYLRMGFGGITVTALPAAAYVPARQ